MFFLNFYSILIVYQAAKGKTATFCPNYFRDYALDTRFPLWYYLKHG